MGIVIVNYNTRVELRACLESLRQDPTPVLVFDNASLDGSAAMVRQEFPGVALIEYSRNLGYGAASNRAIAACPYDYVILSNSDVIFSAGAAASLRDYLVTNPAVGLAGPRLLNADGTLQPSCLPFPGNWRWVFDNDVVGKGLRHVPGVRGRLLRTWPHAAERKVPTVKGAVMAIRRKAFDEVNGFDETFFMYYEESDLCLRLAQRGWEVRFTPVASFVHQGGASTAKVRTEMAVEQFVSLMRFARRHYNRFHCVALQGLWKAILFFRLLRDRRRLAGIGNEAQRQRLMADVAAWRRALHWSSADTGRRVDD
jgi:GT2 family glycosyltransferase